MAKMQALPLAFEANRGQTDPQARYMARGKDYTLFLTSKDAVFSLRSSQPSGREGNSKFISKQSMVAHHDTGRTASIRMKFVGGNPQPAIAGGAEVPGKINYYIGTGPSKWLEGVQQYEAVTYRDMYPGINLKFHGRQQQLEFDFIVTPESDPAPIKLGFVGARSLITDADGNLILVSNAGNVCLHKPVAYQEKDGQREPVEAAFNVEQGNRVAFALGPYDRSRELVIDPTLTYATYLGGASEDEVFGIALDSSNNVYVTGESDSTAGFPGGNASGNGFDVFITKINSSGTLAYTTFVGGSGNDSGLAITTDSSGGAYVTGFTQSTDFPTSASAAEPTSGGGGNCTNLKNTNQPCSDGFALKLDSAGARSWSTYVAGTNDDEGYAIALDSQGNVWVAGDTFSSSFYPNSHASSVLYSTFNNGVSLNPPADDGFVVEINSTGTAFVYSTYLGGSFSDQINGIVIDTIDSSDEDSIYVTGETASTDFPVKNAYQASCGSDGSCNAHSGQVFYDGFVTKLAAGGSSLIYSTYIGGSSDDYAFAIALDSSGDAYITGETSADDTTTTPAVPYPTTSGAFSTQYNAKASNNAFVTEFNPSGSKLVYSTFLGGSVQDLGGGISVDKFGDAYVTGMTGSSDFPVTSNAFQSALKGSTNAFVTQVLSGGAALGLSSFLGGTGSEDALSSGAVGSIGLDSSNNIWVAGSTSSTNFPVTANALEGSYGGGSYDGFVSEISSATNPDFNITATTPSAVNPGASGSSTVTVAALFNYSQSVTLSCSVTGSGTPLPSCSSSSAFSPNPITNGSGQSTLTITTTPSTSALNAHKTTLYAVALPLLAVPLLGVCIGRKRTRSGKFAGSILLGLIVAALLLFPACGGSSSSGGGGGGGGTPAGNYTVTITGTDGNGLSHSTAVTLTVN